MRVKLSKTTLIVVAIAILSLLFACFIRVYRENLYTNANDLQNQQEYKEAQAIFSTLGNFKDSKQRALYNQAQYEYKEGNKEVASNLFEKLGDYEDSHSMIDQIKAEDTEKYEEAYQQAIKHYKANEFRTALTEFNVLDNYKDSKCYSEKCVKGLRKQLASTIASGTVYSIGITTDGLLSTGQIDGQLNDITRDGLVSISANGYYAVGLYDDGKVIISGNNPWYNSISGEGWENVIQVSAAYDYVAVLFENGKVDYRGYDDISTYGEELGIKNWEDMVYIDSGYHLTAGVDIDGNVHVGGWNGTRIQEEINHGENWKDIVAVAVGGGDKDGEGFVIGLKSNGDVVAAGNVSNGINEVDKWHNVAMISAADYHVIGVTKDNEILAVMNQTPSTSEWDAQTCCEVKDLHGLTIAEVEAGNATSSIVTRDGVVYSRGYDFQQQIPQDGEWDGILVYDEWIKKQ